METGERGKWLVRRLARRLQDQYSEYSEMITGRDILQSNWLIWLPATMSRLECLREGKIDEFSLSLWSRLSLRLEPGAGRAGQNCQLVSSLIVLKLSSSAQDCWFVVFTSWFHGWHNMRVVSMAVNRRLIDFWSAGRCFRAHLCEKARTWQKKCFLSYLVLSLGRWKSLSQGNVMCLSGPPGSPLSSSTSTNCCEIIKWPKQQRRHLSKPPSDRRSQKRRMYSLEGCQLKRLHTSSEHEQTDEWVARDWQIFLQTR